MTRNSSQKLFHSRHFNNFTYKLTVIVLLIAFFPALISGAEKSDTPTSSYTDSVSSPKPNIIKRVIDYFGKANIPHEDGRLDISFIGGPHYSSEEKFGIGVVAAARYGQQIRDSVSNRLYHPEVSMYGDFTTSGSVMFGMRGTHVFREDNSRIVYDAFFEYEPSRFWGIGFNKGKYADRYTKFHKMSLRVTADYPIRVYRNLFIGPSLDFAFFRAVKIEDHEIWGGARPRTLSFGAGGMLMVDNRDNITAPTSGIYATASLLAYPQFAGNYKNTFFSLQTAYNIYNKVWRGGVIATRLHGAFTFGSAPWSMQPTFGGSYNMRGYYPGRFIDNNEVDLTVELRQNVWRRSGIAVWTGAATIFPHVRNLRWKRILPNAGIGYRWEFKKNSNVRIDFGVGRGTTGFVFNINEAF